MTETSTENKPRTALFAGTFNPFTAGHADIVARSLHLFDRVVIGIGVNRAKTDGDGARSEAFRQIGELYAAEPRVEVAEFSGLTVDFARQIGACALVRGVRNVRDFEYERDMADINGRIAGLDTVLLVARPELAAVSSSIVRELRAFGVDVDGFLPEK